MDIGITATDTTEIMEHLERKEGYRYTQVAETEISERVLAEELYIPDGQSGLWTLITEAEADEYQKAKDAAMAAMETEYNGGVSAAADTDDAAAESHTVEITCPHCGKTIYYTPAVDDTTAVAAGEDEDGEAAIMIDDEL